MRIDTVAASRHAAAAAAVGAVALGLAWRDTLLIALACVAGFRLLLGQLRGDASLAAWRAGLRCITLGALGMAVATVLLILAGGALLGWWVVEHPHPKVVLATLAVAGALLTAARIDWPEACHEIWTWVVLGVCTALAFWLAEAGYAAPCLLVAGIGVNLAWNSWVVARGMASDLLRDSQRS